MEPNPAASPISGTAPPAANRWKPGQSGNPGGRPRNESIVSLLRRVLEQEHHGRPLKEILAERLVKEALAGKIAFVKEVLERVEGTVSQRHEVSVASVVASISDDQFIALARKHNRLDLLPVDLRALAEKQERRGGAGL